MVELSRADGMRAVSLADPGSVFVAARSTRPSIRPPAASTIRTADSAALAGRSTVTDMVPVVISWRPVAVVSEAVVSEPAPGALAAPPLESAATLDPAVDPAESLVVAEHPPSVRAARIRVVATAFRLMPHGRVNDRPSTTQRLPPLVRHLCCLSPGNRLPPPSNRLPPPKTQENHHRGILFRLDGDAKW
jgi:hypothetical protein